MTSFWDAQVEPEHNVEAASQPEKGLERMLGTGGSLARRVREVRE
jgi:hypothetical protein